MTRWEGAARDLGARIGDIDAGLALALGAAAYLTFALLFPERLS